jgi:hypothetical protein
MEFPPHPAASVQTLSAGRSRLWGRLEDGTGWGLGGHPASACSAPTAVPQAPTRGKGAADWL